MMGYYKSPEALVRFRRAGKKEGRGQQREDKEGICPAFGGLLAGRGETVQPRGPPSASPRPSPSRPGAAKGSGSAVLPGPAFPWGGTRRGSGAEGAGGVLRRTPT